MLLRPVIDSRPRTFQVWLLRTNHKPSNRDKVSVLIDESIAMVQTLGPSSAKNCISSTKHGSSKCADIFQGWGRCEIGG